MTGCAARLVGPLIPAFVFTDGLLSLAGINLGREYLTSANGLTGKCPDVGILHLSANGRLEHFLEDLALVSGHSCLQLALVGKVCTKAGEGGARIKAIHKGLANTDKNILLVNEWTRGSKI
jgi:hypothetical protein